MTLVISSDLESLIVDVLKIGRKKVGAFLNSGMTTLMYRRAFGKHMTQRLYSEVIEDSQITQHYLSATVQHLRENGEFRPSNTERGRDRPQTALDVE